MTRLSTRDRHKHRHVPLVYTVDPVVATLLQASQQESVGVPVKTVKSLTLNPINPGLMLPRHDGVEASAFGASSLGIPIFTTEVGFKAWGCIGPEVVPFCGSYLESYQVIPKRNY